MENITQQVTTAINATVIATTTDPNNLFVVGGSILAVILVISSLIAFFKNILGFRSWVLRNSTIRRFYWYITNRKISIRIAIQRKYRSFDPNLQELLEHIQPNINGKFGIFFSPPEITGNTLQFVAERMSAPIIFSFVPDDNADDDLEPESSPLDFTIVQCKILGNLTFVYREFESYQTILTLIDEIYRQIENDYHLGNPAFSNILIEGSLSYDFNENWSKKDVIICDGAKILIGSKIIQANSKTISPLLHLEKYIIKIPSSDVISAQ